MCHEPIDYTEAIKSVMQAVKEIHAATLVDNAADRAHELALLAANPEYAMERLREPLDDEDSPLTEMLNKIGEMLVKMKIAERVGARA